MNSLAGPKFLSFDGDEGGTEGTTNEERHTHSLQKSTGEVPSSAPASYFFPELLGMRVWLLKVFLGEDREASIFFHVSVWRGRVGGATLRGTQEVSRGRDALCRTWRVNLSLRFQFATSHPLSLSDLSHRQKRREKKSGAQSSQPKRAHDGVGCSKLGWEDPFFPLNAKVEPGSLW